MPRGIYNRSKTGKSAPSKKTVSASKTKYAAKALTDGQRANFSLIQSLDNINSCVSILERLPISGISASARDGLYALINHMVNEAVPAVVGKEKAAEIASSAKEDSTIGKVLFQNNPVVSSPREAMSSSVKLKKDGTPKRRPGPKPRAEVVAATNTVVQSQNGHTEVFNPEHA